MKNTIIFLLLSSSSVLSLSQTYQFENYGVNEGLPGRFIYTINQDNDGFIWLGTGNGLCYFDGYEYHMTYVSDTLEAIFPVSSCKSSDGLVYFGFNDGTVCYVEDRSLEQISGIEADWVNDIIEYNDSLIFIISQSKGIYVYDPAKPLEVVSVNNPVEENLYCGDFTPDGKIVLGTQNGLVLCRFENDELTVITRAEELDYKQVRAMAPSRNPNTYFIGTEDDGVYSASIVDDIINIQRVGEENIFTRSRIQSLITDAKGALWISTFGNGLIKVDTDSTTATIQSYDVFDTAKGLPGNDIKTCYEDNWKNIWIGQYGNGVSVLSSEAFKFFTPGELPNRNNIIHVDGYRGYVFAGTAEGYYLFDPENEEIVSYTDLSRSVNMTRISSYYINTDGSIFLGTEDQGVYKRDRQGVTERFFRSGNNLENYISDILDEAGYIWLATRSGVIIINKSSGETRRFTTSEKLPHNNINHLQPDGKGNIIVATESNRLYTINPEDSVKAGETIIPGDLRKFQCFDVDSQDRIWGATLGSGVFYFEDEEVRNLNNVSGLFSNFCYSILCDSKNNIWIGHQRGFSVYDQGRKTIQTYEDIFRTGADCNENAVYETSEGFVIIGTTAGIMVYNPEKDISKLNPPKTNILSVTINDSIMPLKDVYNLPYKPWYNVTVEYVGLNYSDPEKVQYSYSMENYDTEWSDLTRSRSVKYRLNDGNYRFNILAYRDDGISDNQVQSFVLNIKKPFWRTWWFISLSVFLLVVVVIVIIKVRERAQARAKKFLEEELAERTKEVIAQKEEIEYQNREITDSINYAQRIQASLLPPVKRLNENFKGSFVFFRPRDIVSGDFYWFDMISDDKIMIVCADSTGHGVPGAFMSMIGSALLQEIVNRKEITRPSEILRALDIEITTTLNQTGDSTSNDGMDMVVCEYNPKNRLLRFASALRPVIIVMEGEQYYIRGNKNSVGGEYMEEKFFDDQEYYLKENDIVYIFSDGYPDQFGGADGKKLKIVRLKRLIDDVKDLGMEEQLIRFRDYFDEWKGSYAQVDDVLLMGFRV